MTEEQIKEQLALFYFCLLAARMGCKIKQPLFETGTCLKIEQPGIASTEKGTQHYSTGKNVEVQIKTITANEQVLQDNYIKFLLPVDSYDEFIFRKNQQLKMDGIQPLILVLLVLPENEDEWIEITKDEDKTTFSGAMYWYKPGREMDFSTQELRQAILIPLENTVNLNFFADIFTLAFK